MKHFAMHKPAKIQSSLLCCGNVDSAVYFYHSDHLGSASWITDGNGTPVQHLQYMPNGEPFVNERITGCEERFTFTGKERDSETGFSYFGARYYDSDLMTGWLSVDPMADKYPGLSPYAYCAWNPVKLVDPDGEEIWKPDADGNLIAEKGDNIQTLSNFLNITYSEAQALLENQGYREGEIIKKGDKIRLDNAYTRSISNTPKGNYRKNKTNGYNCWGASISGSQNKEITYGCGIDYGNMFDDILESEYLPVPKEEAVFGKTVIRFANDKNEVQHGAVYYGTSNDGTTYVYTKNGWYEKPTVMKLDVLQKKIPIYGKVQGINNNSGYYNPK